jgi:hypothetical protein
MNPELPSRKPTLEELLRVKRAERPPAEFWKRFEEELRAKQLAAIVAPRPWWRSLAVFVPGRRASALAGVGAAVAVAFAAYVRFPSARQNVVTQVAEVARPATSVIPAPAASLPEANLVAEVAAVAPSVVAIQQNAAVTTAEPVRETALAASLANPVPVKFSEIQVPPPQAAMEFALPAAGLAFAANLRKEAGSPEPLAAIATPRGQRLANVTELAMMAMPAPSQARNRDTPRDTDLREREIRRLSAKGDRFGINF